VVKYNFFLRKRKKIQKKNSKKKKKKKEASCLSGPCLNEGQCSTRLNGKYHCECLPGYLGTNCTNNSTLFIYIILFYL